MTAIKKTKKEPIKNEDANRFAKYAKASYFIEKNKKAEELLKKAPIPDWIKN